jgi:hypothetical protein
MFLNNIIYIPEKVKQLRNEVNLIQLRIIKIEKVINNNASPNYKTGQKLNHLR